MNIQEIGYSDFFNNIDNRNMFVGQDYLDYIEGREIAEQIANNEME